MTQFEDVLETVGSFGRYQKFQCFFLISLCGITIFKQLGNSFYSASDEHYCKVYTNQTFVQSSMVKNCTIPCTIQGNNIVWDKCRRYDVNISQELSSDVCFPRSNKTLRCDQGWVYDKHWYENTVVFEYDLVCDNDWMKQLSKSIVPVGNIVGFPLFGQLSDIYGRRPIMIITLVFTVVSSIGTAFSPTYIAFILGQFCIGLFAKPLQVSCQVLMTEMVGVKARVMCIVLGQISWCLCYILLGIIAWLCSGNWRMIQLISGLTWACFLPYIFFITESPMWLLQIHRYGEFVKVMRRFAKFNRTTLSDDILDEKKAMTLTQQVDRTKKRQYTMADLLKTSDLRIKTLVICLNWFSCGFVYYGISLNTDQIADNPYAVFVFTGLVEIPGRFLAWYLMQRIGRRWCLCGCQVLGGVTLILSVIPRISAVSISLVLLTKLCIAAVVTTMFVYAIELFPTVVRSAGMGVSATCFGLGNMVSPYVILLDGIWDPLPFVIMGLMAVIPGLTVPILPETRNIRLPGTIEEGEAQTRATSSRRGSVPEESQVLLTRRESKTTVAENPNTYGAVSNESSIET